MSHPLYNKATHYLHFIRHGLCSITLEETRKAQQLGPPSSALVASSDLVGPPDDGSPSHSTSTHHRNPPNASRGRGCGRVGRSPGGRGRAYYQQPAYPQQPRYPPPPYSYGPWPYSPYMYGPPTTWASAPCPYPVQQNPQAAPRPTATPGILGPRPSQAYAASAAPHHVSAEPYSDPVPTDVEAALHTITINPPDDSWYMDTGASSHMTGESGTLTSYFNSSNIKNILVGNGHTIPVHGRGSTSLSASNPPFPSNMFYMLLKSLKISNVFGNSLLITMFLLNLTPLVFM